MLPPGSVIPHPEGAQVHLDNVFVEFDDGDSNEIPLRDIRLLPMDYPVTCEFFFFCKSNFFFANLIFFLQI